MKTILVPTDFSKASENALNYAVEIAKRTQATLVLFHVFQIPVVPAETPITLPYDEIEKDATDSLKKLRESIILKNGNKINVQYECKLGFIAEEIKLISEKNQVDLIIMGMEGAGFLTEKIIGSVTTSLINKAKCPVMIIGNEVKFKSIKKIVLASDYNEIKNKSVLKPLKELANLFKSHVYVLNVVKPELSPISSTAKAAEGIKLSHLLEDVEHSFHYSENENVIDGINNFVALKQIDILVMIPRVHTALHNLFIEPQTKQMAFHTQIPLLTIHE